MRFSTSHELPHEPIIRLPFHTRRRIELISCFPADDFAPQSDAPSLPESDHGRNHRDPQDQAPRHPSPAQILIPPTPLPPLEGFEMEKGHVFDSTEDCLSEPPKTRRPRNDHGP